MKLLINEAIKELRRRLRDPWVFLLWVGIPLLVGTLITVGTGGAAGPKPVAKLLVVDNDESFGSSLLLTSLQQGKLKEMISLESVSQEIGEERMQQGEDSALLIIPDGFGTALLRDKPTILTLKTNPKQTVLPKIIVEVLRVEVDAVFYAQRVFGDELRDIAKAVDSRDNEPEPDDKTVAEISQKVNKAVGEVRPYLFPPAVRFNIEELPGNGGRRASFGLLFFPGVLMMAVLFIAQGLSGDVWVERELGTLSRMTATPHGLSCFVIGKVVTAALLFFVIGAFVSAIGFAYHGISFAKLPLAAGWLVLAGCALFLIMLLIQLYSPTRKSAGLITGMVLFPLMMLGGSFFPFEALPQWMALVGKWSPNGLMLEELKLFLLDRHSAGRMFAVGTFVSASSLGLMALAMRRCHRFLLS